MYRESICYTAVIRWYEGPSASNRWDHRSWGELSVSNRSRVTGDRGPSVCGVSKWGGEGLSASSWTGDHSHGAHVSTVPARGGSRVVVFSPSHMGTCKLLADFRVG